MPPHFLLTINLLTSSAEKQGNAPKTSQSNQSINDPAEYSTLATEEPCNKIKLENANQAPVDGTNDGKDQCDRIHRSTSIYIIRMFLSCPELYKLCIDVNLQAYRLQFVDL